jgi:hypothetical protein
MDSGSLGAGIYMLISLQGEKNVREKVASVA